MWPWGHLAVGYLGYRLYRSLADRVARPSLSLGVVVAVAIGSQFPDLIDKPLAWTFAVLPSGRSLAHSLLTLTAVAAELWWVTQKYGHEADATAFLIGWLSHSLADLGPNVVGGLLAGDLSQLVWTTYLVWPLLPPPPYTTTPSFVAHFSKLSLTSYVSIQFGLLFVTGVLWLVDGKPGYDALRRLLVRTIASR